MHCLLEIAKESEHHAIECNICWNCWECVVFCDWVVLWWWWHDWWCWLWLRYIPDYLNTVRCLVENLAL